MSHYTVVAIKNTTSRDEARALTTFWGDYNTTVYDVADWDEGCSKGADHSHARYDGATYCSSCGLYLDIQIAKRL